jgi:RNA polymerase sigma factor (sigma-70 family)
VRLIEQALESLNDKERAVFVLVELEATTVAQAAQVLGLNPNTAQGRLRTARAEFQRAVQRLRAARVERRQDA